MGLLEKVRLQGVGSQGRRGLTSAKSGVHSSGMRVLAAMHKVTPGRARSVIIEAFRASVGNLRQTARQLDTSYRTLQRLVQKDEILRQQIEAVRAELAENEAPLQGGAMSAANKAIGKRT